MGTLDSVCFGRVDGSISLGDPKLQHDLLEEMRGVLDTIIGMQGLHYTVDMDPLGDQSVNHSGGHLVFERSGHQVPGEPVLDGKDILTLFSLKQGWC